MPKLNTTTSGIITATLTADSSPTLDLQENGVTFRTLGQSQLVSGVAVTASGTSVDFPGIPSWAKRITVMFSGVSTNGTSPPQIQVGSGSFTTSGYLGSNTISNSGSATVLFTAGFGIGVNTSNWNGSQIFSGAISLFLLSGNTWAAFGINSTSNSNNTYFTSGSIALSGILDRVRITTANGTDVFDAGTINIMWE
jgi:hypothetical protein